MRHIHDTNDGSPCPPQCPGSPGHTDWIARQLDEARKGNAILGITQDDLASLPAITLVWRDERGAEISRYEPLIAELPGGRIAIPLEAQSLEIIMKKRTRPMEADIPASYTRRSLRRLTIIAETDDHITVISCKNPGTADYGVDPGIGPDQIRLLSDSDGPPLRIDERYISPNMSAYARPWRHPVQVSSHTPGEVQAVDLLTAGELAELREELH